MVGARELAVGLLDVVRPRRPWRRRGRRRSPCWPSRPACRRWCSPRTSLRQSVPCSLGRGFVDRPSRVGPLGRVDHQHLRGAHHPVADPVAGLGDHLAGGHLDVGVLPDVGEGLVDGRGRTASPSAPNLVSPRPVTTRSSCSATAWKPPSRSPCSRARSMVSRTSMIGASARYVAFSPDQLPVAVDPALVVEELRLQPLQVGGPLGERASASRSARRRPPGLRGRLVEPRSRRPSSSAPSPAGGRLLLAEGASAGRLRRPSRRPAVGPRSPPDAVVGLGHLFSPSVPSVAVAGSSARRRSRRRRRRRRPRRSSRRCPPAAAWSASAAAYIAAPIFWLDSPSLVDAGLDLLGRGLGVLEGRLERVDVGLDLGLDVLGDLLGVLLEELLGGVDELSRPGCGSRPPRAAWRPPRRTARPP